MDLVVRGTSHLLPRVVGLGDEIECPLGPPVLDATQVSFRRLLCGSYSRYPESLRQGARFGLGGGSPCVSRYGVDSYGTSSLPERPGLGVRKSVCLFDLKVLIV